MKEKGSELFSLAMLTVENSSDPFSFGLALSSDPFLPQRFRHPNDESLVVICSNNNRHAVLGECPDLL
jgi:hypothetical protein